MRASCRTHTKQCDRHSTPPQRSTLPSLISQQTQNPIGKFFRSLLRHVMANALEDLPAIRADKMTSKWIVPGRWIDRISAALQNQRRHGNLWLCSKPRLYVPIGRIAFNQSETMTIRMYYHLNKVVVFKRCGGRIKVSWQIPRLATTCARANGRTPFCSRSIQRDHGYRAGSTGTRAGAQLRVNRAYALERYFECCSHRS